MAPREPVHFSTLKAMALSPAHYRYGLSARHDTPAMRLGRAVHAYVLLGQAPVVFEGAARRGKAWESFAAATPRPEDALLLDDADAVFAMGNAVLAHDEAMEALAGEREVRLRWEWLGRQCEGTADVLSPTGVCDLKTTRTPHADRFIREALGRSYHAQLWWYGNGAQASGRPRPAAASLVVVESMPPYVVTVYRLTLRALAAGERLARSWMERLLACEEADCWPGYAQCAIPLDVADDGLRWGDEEDE